MRVKFLLGLAVGLAIVFFASFSQHVNAESTKEVVVEISQLAFKPQNIEIAQGTKVTWINKDPAMHTVTQGEPGKLKRGFDSGFLNQGQSWSFTFKEPGTYLYYCVPHPFMRGTIIMKDDQPPIGTTPTPVVPEGENEESGGMPVWGAVLGIVILICLFMVLGFGLAFVMGGASRPR